jgi:kumamolisin
VVGLGVLLLTAAGVGVGVNAISAGGSHGEAAAPTIPADAGYWSQALAGSEQVGPSSARAVEVAVTLATGAARPERLIAWTRNHGLHALWVTGEPAAVLSGSAPAVGSALSDPIREYRAANGRRFYQAMRTPAVPAALRGVVTGIGTISSYGSITSDPVLAGAPASGVSPLGFLQAYDAVPLVAAGNDGSGETIVFLETDGYKQADFDKYASQFTPGSPLDPTIAGGLAAAGDEAPMDLEVAHGIAPGAKIVYWNLGISNAGQLPAAITSAVTQATQDFPGAIFSVSLGACEQAFDPADISATTDAIAAAENKGSSFYVSSGDNGGEECLNNWGDAPTQSGVGIQFPSDLPDVTAVGGTALDVATTGAWLGETSWTESFLSEGSTGGISTLVPMPSWQKGPGVVSSTSSGQPCGDSSGLCRETPDVAADGDPATGATIIEGGQTSVGGGTSLATPIWAGLTAVIDQYLKGHGDNPVGFGNPYFYELAAKTNPAAFHDITEGGNDWYQAGPGYDMVTGLGSPIVANLASDLAPLVGTAGG